MVELDVAVTVIRVNLPVLLPEQLLGHALALEFLVYAGEVGLSEAALAASYSLWQCPCNTYYYYGGLALMTVVSITDPIFPAQKRCTSGEART